MMIAQDRTTIFLGIMAAIYVWTCLLGTAILQFPSFLRYVRHTREKVEDQKGLLCPNATVIGASSQDSVQQAQNADVTAENVQKPRRAKKIKRKKARKHPCETIAIAVAPAAGVRPLGPDDVGNKVVKTTRRATKPDRQPGSSSVELPREAAEAKSKDIRKRPRLQERWLVVPAFVGTWAVCLGTTVYCMHMGLLTKETGLPWEAYTFLFGAGCAWQVLQAMAAAWYLQEGQSYSPEAFALATVSGVWPFFSDAYDTMKDILFGGLCLTSESKLTVALGICTWAYLLIFHAYFFCWNHYGSMAELASNHLAVWTAATASGRNEDDGIVCCSSEWWSKIWWNKVVPILYKQVTPTKRFMLCVENLPQAASKPSPVNLKFKLQCSSFMKSLSNSHGRLQCLTAKNVTSECPFALQTPSCA